METPQKIAQKIAQKNIKLGHRTLMKELSDLKKVGVLTAVDIAGATISVEKKVKPEGAKRPVMVTEEEKYPFEEIKYTKYLIRFK